MHLKRFFCVVLVCMLFVGLVGMPVGATELEDTVSENAMLNFMLSRATGSFNMTIPAKTKLSASTSFPLAAGETVTIKASYSPFSASVDFGLIGSIMPRATLALSFSSLGKDGSVYSPETYYIDDGKSKLNIISATWDSQNSEVGIGWYNVSSGILYFTRYSGGSASDEAISSGNVPTGNYKVCLMNLGTEEITGSLQYSVTRAWP